MNAHVHTARNRATGRGGWPQAPSGSKAHLRGGVCSPCVYPQHSEHVKSSHKPRKGLQQEKTHQVLNRHLVKEDVLTTSQPAGDGAPRFTSRAAEINRGGAPPRHQSLELQEAGKKEAGQGTTTIAGGGAAAQYFQNCWSVAGKVEWIRFYSPQTAPKPKLIEFLKKNQHNTVKQLPSIKNLKNSINRSYGPAHHHPETHTSVHQKTLTKKLGEAHAGVCPDAQPQQNGSTVPIFSHREFQTEGQEQTAAAASTSAGPRRGAR